MKLSHYAARWSLSSSRSWYFLELRHLPNVRWSRGYRKGSKRQDARHPQGYGPNSYGTHWTGCEAPCGEKMEVGDGWHQGERSNGSIGAKGLGVTGAMTRSGTPVGSLLGSLGLPEGRFPEGCCAPLSLCNAEPPLPPRIWW